MEVIFVDRPKQDANTKHPQFIHGTIFEWNCKHMICYQSYNKTINKLSKEPYLRYLLIHDLWASVDGDLIMHCDKIYIDDYNMNLLKSINKERSCQ